ncbi:putative potassium transport system protein kup 1 [Alsobacter metallidurans]|uniref:Probable potassium transport system protein Kup n=1 Tax=Alsobacter metallidurans TaxID=340221 RepID=A0A917I6M6_9HYPH|nr:putative potassium transport system protein kup 1 [Alsobacter metallidurans]
MGESAAAQVAGHGKSHGQGSLVGLTVGSIGVVYGDIGTSPLYAFREALLAAVGAHNQAGAHPLVPRDTVLGVLSLIVWALLLVVTAKYVLILLRADNNGEGGTLSLMALAQRTLTKGRSYMLALGVVGASMFYGDSVITPAISVLSAVEGMKLITPALEHYVVPITIGILVLLFAVQSRGTAKVAAAFGPIMIAWFGVLALGGITHISDDPGVVLALNPAWGMQFLVQHKLIGLVTLGAVFLAVTGGEALYADLGHFGRRPIQIAWLGLVLPALVINYFGQGALVLSNPQAIDNPLFMLYPDWALIPVVGLATAATIIASQAVITGAFSLTRQAVQLGLLPRIDIRFTSETHSGQIYIPRINTLLLMGVIILVLLFRSSSSLASAYGIAVTTTMVVDATLAFIVIWRMWRWKPWAAALLVAPFLLIDTTFLAANLLKLLDGAWAPLVFASCLILLMATWRKGTRILADKTRRSEVPLEMLVRNLEKKPPHRVQGTAVFLTSDPDYAPTALLHNLKHNKILHDKNVILTVSTADTPRVREEDRITISPVSEHFSRVKMTFGYMESPNVPRGLAIARKLGWTFDIMSTSFFVSRRSIKPAAQSGMPLWQDKLFIALARNASDATDFFQIPTGRVVEVGTQVTV